MKTDLKLIQQLPEATEACGSHWEAKILGASQICYWYYSEQNDQEFYWAYWIIIFFFCILLYWKSSSWFLDNLLIPEVLGCYQFGHLCITYPLEPVFLYHTATNMGRWRLTCETYKVNQAYLSKVDIGPKAQEFGSQHWISRLKWELESPSTIVLNCHVSICHVSPCINHYYKNKTLIMQQYE